MTIPREQQYLELSNEPVKFSFILHSNILEEQKKKLNNIKDLLKENNIKIKPLPFKTTFNDNTL
jgi:hypothetical protein